nr:DUF805 domain-containing protein [Enterococcus faecalis]
MFGLGIETFSMFVYKKSLIENNYLKYFVINGPFDFYNFLRIVFFIMIIIGFLFQARRFVDIGWSKFVALLSLLPLVGVPSAYEEFVSIRNRFKNFAVILYI